MLRRTARVLQIWEWTRAFCEGTQASGQLCFDFMKDAQDGRMYAFECNPRASTILLNFYRQPEVAAAFFNPQARVRARCIPCVVCRRCPPAMGICRLDDPQARLQPWGYETASMES